MATNVNAWLQIRALATITATSPASGDVVLECVNSAGGTRWTNGTGSGNVDRAFYVSDAVAAAATDSYNLLAAGSLEDIYNQAIDADELKGLVIKCLTGAIKVVGTTGTPIGLFVAAGDGINLAAGHTLAVDFGATGLTVSTNSLFEITDTAGGSGSTYELWFVVAQ